MSDEVEVYSSPARAFHWIMAVLVLLQLPVGFYMVYRGTDLKIWDDLTGNLYTGHKLFGAVLLALILMRFLYRMSHGAPKLPAFVAPWQKMASEFTHWMIYALLIAVPVLGYIGTSMFGALNIWGLFKLPAVTAVDKEFAKVVLAYHGWAAIALSVLVGVHIAAALYHRIVLKDLVVARMIPSVLKKKTT